MDETIIDNTHNEGNLTHTTDLEYEEIIEVLQGKIEIQTKEIFSLKKETDR